jgi:hypothetical protein
MTGDELLGRIGNSYEEPILSVRRQPSWPNVSNPLHLALLLVDFDTELSMNGILGFLENSTGAFLDQTIDGFRLVGAGQTATTLSEIRDAMQRHSASHNQLRADFEGTSQYQITSFARLHPDREAFADEVERIAKSLYLNGQSRESPFLLLEGYLEKHSEEFLSQLGSAEGGLSVEESKCDQY